MILTWRNCWKELKSTLCLKDEILTVDEVAEVLLTEPAEWIGNPNIPLQRVNPTAWIINPAKKKTRKMPPPLYVKLHESVEGKIKESLRTENLLSILFSNFYGAILGTPALRETFLDRLKLKDTPSWFFQQNRPEDPLLFYVVLIFLEDKAWGAVLELRFGRVGEDYDKLLLVRGFSQWQGLERRSRPLIKAMVEELLKMFVSSYYAKTEFWEFKEPDGSILKHPARDEDGIYMEIREGGRMKSEFSISADIVRDFYLIIVED